MVDGNVEVVDDGERIVEKPVGELVNVAAESMSSEDVERVVGCADWE